VNPEPALLIVAPVADGFDLAHIPWSRTARERISVNNDKFSELDMLEIIVDGMPFLLSHFATEETGQIFARKNFKKPSADVRISHQSAIGVTPRDILTSGQHLPEIIHRILLLGKWIGDSLAATAVILVPSSELVSFEYFDEAVKEYFEGRPLPSSLLAAFPEA
jgi:hypothetical protein